MRGKAAFFARTARASNGCLEWTGLRNNRRGGYGELYWGGRMRRAHRVAWELSHGPIPPGMFVCHRCDNPPCVDVAHLFIGAPLDNMLDKIAKGRDRSLRGQEHPKSLVSDADVASMRAMYARGIRAPEIARSFGLKRHTAYLIATGRRRPF